MKTRYVLMAATIFMVVGRSQAQPYIGVLAGMAET